MKLPKHFPIVLGIGVETFEIMASHGLCVASSEKLPICGQAHRTLPYACVDVGFSSSGEVGKNPTYNQARNIVEFLDAKLPCASGVGLGFRVYRGFGFRV